jgi:bacillopeptidase F
MRKIALAVGFVILVSGLYVVAQDKPPQAPMALLSPDPCNLVYTAHDWDFAVSDQGFTTTGCDDGGEPVWAWGTSTIAGAPGTVWGTVLAGNYPNNSGEGLLTPPFDVTAITDKMEILSYLQTETNFDGCNVKVNDTLLQPSQTYNATISTSTSYYAYCVDGQPGWTGSSSTPSQDWVQQCFDLSAYVGQTIQVRFDFGSDSSVSYPGWYLGYVRIGDDEIPVELQSLSVQ